MNIKTGLAQIEYERLLKENFQKEKEFFSDKKNAKFEKDKEKIEINRLNEIARVRNTQLNILIGFSILLPLLTLLATILQNKYKKSNATLEQKNTFPSRKIFIRISADQTMDSLSVRRLQI